MPLAALLPLIIQYGLPLAQSIWTKIQSGKDVTQADWDELNQIANQTAASHLASAVAKAAIDPKDPRVVALAELIK